MTGNSQVSDRMGNHASALFVEKRSPLEFQSIIPAEGAARHSLPLMAEVAKEAQRYLLCLQAEPQSCRSLRAENQATGRRRSDDAKELRDMPGDCPRKKKKERLEHSACNLRLSLSKTAYSPPPYFCV